MNRKAEAAANMIMLAFQSGGIVPLEHTEPDKYARVSEHVQAIVGRVMKNEREKRERKRAGFARARKEATL